MLLARQKRHQYVLLRTVTNLMAIGTRTRIPVHFNGAIGWSNVAEYHRHGGRFAGAIVPQQHCDLVFKNIEIHIVDGRYTGAAEFCKRFDQTSHFDHLLSV